MMVEKWHAAGQVSLKFLQGDAQDGRGLWRCFERADEFAYAMDMDTHEIIYMNRKARDAYGALSMDALRGKKCHELFFGNNFPCAICNNCKLTEGEFIKKRCFVPALNKHLLFMTTMVRENGRRCRFGLAIDTDDHAEAGWTHDRYEELEMRVNEGIRHAICEPNPDQSIGIILEFLGRTLKGERAYVFERNALGGDDNTYEWTAAGVTPKKKNRQNLPPEVCKNCYRRFDENQNIMFDDVKAMREGDSPQYANLKKQGIHSSVVVPLFDDGRVIGFYGIDNSPRQELEYALNMLQIVGYFISSMLKRRDMMNELREMSLQDQLTRLGNRHAMHEFMAGLRCEKGMGVVFCDITGLKRTNDTLGHAKGDELICRAAQSLKCALSEYGLFRIGGDELLAICADIDRETLEARVELLRRKAAENEVILAVGMAWEASCPSDMQGLVNAAERRMYEEKSAYYRASGLDRRR